MSEPLKSPLPCEAARSHFDTGASLVTPPGRSAIATVIVRSANALATVAGHCNVDPVELSRRAAQNRIWLGRWHSAHGEPIVIRAIDPHCIEIHCHGGQVAPQSILNDLARTGIPTVAWQQLSIDNATTEIESEAIDSLSQAMTLRAAAILLDQYHGALSRATRNLLKRLDSAATGAAAHELGKLLRYSEVGLHLVQPWRVAIVGRPNVGKSRLFNAIVGFDRSIVHDLAGTTRDCVTAVTAVDGWPVEFGDSAGIRESIDRVESAGIDFSYQAIKQSDCQVVVCDSSRPLRDEDHQISHACPRPILVANKSDLPCAWSSHDHVMPIRTSALTGDGISALLATISATLVSEPPPAGSAVPFTRRQIELMESAHAAVDSPNGIDIARSCLQRCLGGS